MIVPTGIAYDDTTKHLLPRSDRSDESLVSFHSFENEEFLFPAVIIDRVLPPDADWSATTAESLADFVFFCRRTEQLQES